MRLALCFINSYMHLGRSADLIATYCSRRRCKFAANKDADGRLIIQDSAWASWCMTTSVNRYICEKIQLDCLRAYSQYMSIMRGGRRRSSGYCGLMIGPGLTTKHWQGPTGDIWMLKLALNADRLLKSRIYALIAVNLHRRATLYQILSRQPIQA
jgi:hypothetical protein